MYKNNDRDPFIELLKICTLMLVCGVMLIIITILFASFDYLLHYP